MVAFRFAVVAFVEVPAKATGFYHDLIQASG